MEDILHSITAAGYRQLEGRGLALLRFDPQSETFPDMWQLQEGQITRRYSTGGAYTEGAFQVMREGRDWIVENQEPDPQSTVFPKASSIAATAVLVHGIPWGVLLVSNGLPVTFSGEEIAFFQSLARQIGVYIEEARAGTSGNVELSTVRVLAATVDAKDPYTRNHSTNVAFFARRLAREMSLDPVEIHRIDLAGLLHDVGKIAIPDQILQKPGNLTAEELLLIHTHPAIGANILAQAPHLRHLVPLVRHHHERFDGHGYPDRLKGLEIPLGAAIISLADAFDAMTTARVYRPALDLEDTLAEIRRQRGAQFNPDVVAALEALVEKARFAQEPWLRALGAAQDSRVNLVMATTWQGTQGYDADSFGPQHDPLDFLAEARLILQASDLPSLLQRAGDLCMNFWSADAVQIYLVDREINALKLMWSNGTALAEQFLATCREEGPLPLSHGLLGWAALANQGVNVTDARRDPRWQHRGEFPGPVSALVSPFVSGGVVLGVMQVVAAGESHFGRQDVKTARVFSSLLGQAVEYVRATAESREAHVTDRLTGMRNANYLSTFLEEHEVGDSQLPACVAFLDADDLKEFNIRHGHDAGNLVLQHISRCVSAYRRPEDLVIRYAGDKFLIFFPGMSLPDAATVLEQMRMAVAEMPVVLAGGERVHVAVSCGVTEVIPEAGMHRAVRAAEQAMYSAKRTGKNRVWTAVVGVS